MYTSFILVGVFRDYFIWYFAGRLFLELSDYWKAYIICVCRTPHSTGRIIEMVETGHTPRPQWVQPLFKGDYLWQAERLSVDCVTTKKLSKLPQKHGHCMTAALLPYSGVSLTWHQPSGKCWPAHSSAAPASIKSASRLRTLRERNPGAWQVLATETCH